jgi:thymidylate synthase (FAD)
MNETSPVKLVWATPQGDHQIAYMARVSAPKNQANNETAPKLIAYLMRHHHWSPFEMVNMCVEITTTRDIARQLLRHRSFTFQEFSQRYQDVNELPEMPLREVRLQHPTNRQASVETDNKQLAGWWDSVQADLWQRSQVAYQLALTYGVAKEVARAILPEGLTPTRMYMNGTLRSWLHFVALRSNHGTQKETTAIATTCADTLRDTFPVTMEAFDSLKTS